MKYLALTIFLISYSFASLAKDECGYKFSFDLKYEKNSINYDGGFFNLKKSFCDTSRYESNSNYKVIIETESGKKFDKRIFISKETYNEKVVGKEKDEVKIAGIKDQPVYRQVQFELPADYNGKEVTLKVSDLQNNELFSKKIKISNK